ncbi:MAG: hypothetical protein LC808_26160 [Actinobacteria bacterium]|nr:hypothetical protein [Actinomycetota bacterium]
MSEVRDADVVGSAEGNTGHGVIRESWSGPARSKNLCMYGISMRENREVPWLPVWLIIGRAAQGSTKSYA